MLQVSGLYVYPIKSLGGIAVDSALVTSRGLQHDRRLMLVDEDNRFLTQRVHPMMAWLQPVLEDGCLLIHHKKNSADSLHIPLQPQGSECVRVTVWDDDCEAILYDEKVNQWFSRALGFSCRLVYMPDSSERKVDKKYALREEITSFSDGYPMLLIGQASLDDLNKRLDIPVPMNRFRPSIVFTGGEPFAEDQFQAFTVNTIQFNGVKPCGRCVVTTIDQDDLSISKEPLKTLSSFRLKNNKVLFGQNLLHHGEGIIRVGDRMNVTNYQPAAI